jgi:hypothetical protein
MMQVLPFSDDAAYSVVEHFERAVYATAAEAVAPAKRIN